MPQSFATNAILVIVVLAIVFFMWRNNRKRRRDAEELQTKFVPGAEVMTNFGLFGTIVSIDTEANKVVLETSPGHEVTVHRQVIARVVDPVAPSETEADEAEKPADRPIVLNGEPQYGERVEPVDPAKNDEK